MTSARPQQRPVTGEGAVNGFTVLETLAALTVSTWRYSWEPERLRHLGPMAQDWHAAFGLGDTDTKIDLVDANSIAIVAIQALHRQVNDRQQEVAQLHAQIPAAPPDPAR
ncbi:hypothetical protein SLINC_0101 [Streptomyces lincolnensis]|uniref:Tail fiber domain-containing protein n=1 Tax=Streptomyces lincolnensis TaxID=1915 RepID=A0A1B1M146_STRLN|nr:hypothetical protein SLINC_0101 [Streptomyces lincolnensis]